MYVHARACVCVCVCVYAYCFNLMKTCTTCNKHLNLHITL